MCMDRHISMCVCISLCACVCVCSIVALSKIVNNSTQLLFFFSSNLTSWTRCSRLTRPKSKGEVENGDFRRKIWPPMLQPKLLFSAFRLLLMCLQFEKTVWCWRNSAYSRSRSVCVTESDASHLTSLMRNCEVWVRLASHTPCIIYTFRRRSYAGELFRVFLSEFLIESFLF